MDVDTGGADPPDKENVPIGEQVCELSTVNNISNNKVVHTYARDSVGPFIVFIQAGESLHQNIGNLNHFSIAKHIFDLQLKEVKKLDKKGRNRLSIEFTNFEAANNFLTNKSLIDRGYNIFIPSNLVSCKGIVKYVSKSLSTDELFMYSHCPNFKIINIRRLNRRVVKEDGSVEFVPTGTVQYTFAGTVLPRILDIFRLTMPILPYKLPVIQCFNCYRFGHTSRQCKGKKNCANCGGKHEGECTDCRKCLNCHSSEHTATDKGCPEFNRQSIIREKMALVNLTFYDANKKVPKSSSPGLVIHPSDFPPINNRTLDDSIFQNGVTKRSYSHVASSPKKRKNDSNHGFDKSLHNYCLLSPSGRNNLNSTGSSPNTSRKNSMAGPSTVQPFKLTQPPVMGGEKNDITYLNELIGTLPKHYINKIVEYINSLNLRNNSYWDRDRPIEVSSDEFF